MVVRLLNAIPLAFAAFMAVDHARPAAIPPEIEDEQINGINRVPDHSTLIPYANLKEALRADRYHSGFGRSLNGPWKFNWVKRPEERPGRFL